MMAGEHPEVVGADILPVSNLHPIAKAAGQSAEERIELFAERGGVGKDGFGEGTKLEHHRGNAIAVRLERPRECGLEQTVIKERRVLLARTRAVPRMPRPFGNSDLFRHLESKEE